jgi:predicted secreted protein
MRCFNISSAALLVALSIAAVQAQNSGVQDFSALRSKIVHLNASASTQVTRDWLVMNLAVQKKEPDASAL